MYKLDVKLLSSCGNGFLLFAVRMLAKPYHFLGEPTNNTLQKQRWGTFLYPQF